MFWQSLGWTLCLYAWGAEAIVRNLCHGSDRRRIDEALEDVYTMAANSVDQITMNWEEYAIQAGFVVLFPEAERDTVLWVNRQILGLSGAGIVVNIYCDEDHIQWSNILQSWTDTDYSYLRHGRTRHVTYNLHKYDPGAKPGQQSGASYTTLGYNVPISRGRTADCTNQAHVFISAARLRPVPGRQDTRSIRRIVRDGILPEFNALDNIHPLSATLYHELVHVVGGLADLQGRSGAGRITDGPNEDIYGIEQVFRANRASNTLPGATTTTAYADSYTIFAKMCSFQVRRKANGRPHDGFTFWALGVVDPNTLLPPGA